MKPDLGRGFLIAAIIALALALAGALMFILTVTEPTCPAGQHWTVDVTNPAKGNQYTCETIP